MIDESDQLFINKQMEKPMDEQKTENWTSVDMYYKGFHIKKSFGENVNRVTIIKEINDLIEAGFQPSWNPDTNKASVAASTAQTAPQATPVPEDGYTVPCKVCGGATTYRTGVSKASGKPWKGYFCANKDHKPFFIK